LLLTYTPSKKLASLEVFTRPLWHSLPTQHQVANPTVEAPSLPVTDVLSVAHEDAGFDISAKFEFVPLVVAHHAQKPTETSAQKITVAAVPPAPTAKPALQLSDIAQIHIESGAASTLFIDRPQLVAMTSAECAQLRSLLGQSGKPGAKTTAGEVHIFKHNYHFYSDATTRQKLEQSLYNHFLSSDIAKDIAAKFVQYYVVLAHQQSVLNSLAILKQLHFSKNAGTTTSSAHYINQASTRVPPMQSSANALEASQTWSQESGKRSTRPLPPKRSRAPAHAHA
jgi:hypothetical protein